MAMVGVPLPARALPPTPEYEVKAAFLYNFMQFVEWPETAFAAAEAPVCIGVLGDDPFGSALEEIVRGETVGDRPLVVHRSREVTDLIECQVVFISKSEEGRMPALLDALEPRPVLTVGEVAGFARSGGIINFYLEESRVRFEINAKVAQRQGLRMSSQLLNLGRIVESG
jgi:hypothetical protein